MSLETAVNPEVGTLQYALFFSPKKYFNITLGGADILKNVKEELMGKPSQAQENVGQDLPLAKIGRVN